MCSADPGGAISLVQSYPVGSNAAAAELTGHSQLILPNNFWRIVGNLTGYRLF